MICPICNGRGISDVYINGHFKTCEYCNGTGEIFKCPKCGEITHMNNIGSLFDHDYAWYKIECPQCGYYSDGGADPQKAIDMFVKGVGNIPKPLTNEEWFCRLSTEEKADFYAKLTLGCYKCGEKGSHNTKNCGFDYCLCSKQDFIKWLKEKHEE